MESSQRRGNQQGHSGPCASRCAQEAKTKNESEQQVVEKQVCEMEADCTNDCTTDLCVVTAEDLQPPGSRIISQFQALLLAFHNSIYNYP